jgi:microcystin-dependent protein
MSEPYLAEIRIVAFNFAPRGWAFCDGQLLPISQNTALFSLIGTTYGGDGRTTTALPNLRDRAPMHPGRGPGLTARKLGERVGSPTVDLNEAQLPSHTHQPFQNGAALSTSPDPSNRWPSRHIDAASGSTPVEQVYKENPVLDAAFNPAQIANTGGGQAHENMQPYLGLNYVIALAGTYPSRS